MCAGAAQVPVEASAVVVMARRTMTVVDDGAVCRGCAQVTAERDRAGLPMHAVCARAIAATVERETVDFRRWSR